MRYGVDVYALRIANVIERRRGLYVLVRYRRRPDRPLKFLSALQILQADSEPGGIESPTSLPATMAQRRSR
jgi:hypothetical protein